MNPSASRLRTAFVGAIILLVTACGSGSSERSPTAASQQAGLTTVQELGRKAGEGEQCLVCGEAIEGGEVVEMRYKGRRFFVAAPLVEDLIADTDRYFAKLQARAALFDETAYPDSATSNGWLYFGLYVIAGLVFASLCGYLAVTWSMPALPWFFAGLIGNVAAVLVLIAARKGGDGAAVPAGLAKVPTTLAPQTCGACGRLNHPSAGACGGCGATLKPTARSEVARLLEGGAE